MMHVKHLQYELHLFSYYAVLFDLFVGRDPDFVCTLDQIAEHKEQLEAFPGN